MTTEALGGKSYDSGKLLLHTSIHCGFVFNNFSANKLKHVKELKKNMLMCIIKNVVFTHYVHASHLNKTHLI